MRILNHKRMEWWVGDGGQRAYTRRTLIISDKLWPYEHYHFADSGILLPMGCSMADALTEVRMTDGDARYVSFDDGDGKMYRVTTKGAT